MKKIYSPSLLPFIILGLLAAVNAEADIAIIVNPKNSDPLEASIIKNIFMGKVKTFPSGSTAKTFDQSDDKIIRKDFYMKLVEKNEGEMKVYWSNLIFTGDGTPPKSIGGDAEVKKIVSENQNSIGYVDSKTVDATVRTVLILK